MPWGWANNARNQKGLTPEQKKQVNRITTDVNQEAKRRTQQERKATNQDGNRGNR